MTIVASNSITVSNVNDGIAGKAGISIVSVDVEYAKNTSNTNPPTSGWTIISPKWGIGSYIWQRVKTTYSVGNPTYSQPHCIETDTVNNITDYISSRGENLVTNGTGLMKNNTNFSRMVFDGTDNYGSSGSFKYTGGYTTMESDELIPVDPNETYKMSYYIKENPYVGARTYGLVSSYDPDGKSIMASHTMFVANTLTELAQDLKNGDTKIYLNSTSNWINTGTAGVATHTRKLIVWDYSNSYGYTYPPETYSRRIWGNLWDPGAINHTEKSITLKVPWAGGTIAIGTKVSNGYDGGNYKYISGSNFTNPQEWTNKNGLIGGIDMSGQNISNMFFPGTSAVKVGWLLNRDVSGGTTWLTNITFNKHVASQTDLDNTNQKVNETVNNITKATTAIEQNSKEIALKANKTEVDTLSGRVLATESSLQIQDGKITALNTKTDGHTTQIGTLESSYSGLTSTISKIQTDVNGKAGKTELSQLSQDLSGFKTTVANTYADKISVASQITQSATAVTSDVQSWTNNKLTAYSTTQQTATSITNAVADKADKTQITQLSDSINLKVSKGDVVSQINVEAGQILFNSNKLVLNADTTEIAGDAFIRGNMIVDKSITAEKIEVDTLASISANIGDIRAGSITGINILSSSITNVYDFDYNGVRHSGLVTLKDGFNVEDFAEISGKTKYGKVNMIGGGYNTGLNIQEYPDVKDVNSFKMVWVTADGIYFQDNINNFGGSITAENATYVPWTNLILKSGYTTGDLVQPQYRRIKNLDGSYTVQFRGAISPTSGNFPTGQVHVATLSGVYLPPTTSIRQSSDNTGKGARVAMTTSGNLHIMAPNNSSYVYLEALTYVN